MAKLRTQCLHDFILHPRHDISRNTAGKRAQSLSCRKLPGVISVTYIKHKLDRCVNGGGSKVNVEVKLRRSDCVLEYL